MFTSTRTLATLFAVGATATLTVLAPPALAAPPSGSGGGSSSNGRGLLDASIDAYCLHHRL